MYKFPKLSEEVIQSYRPCRIFREYSIPHRISTHRAHECNKYEASWYTIPFIVVVLTYCCYRA